MPTIQIDYKPEDTVWDDLTRQEATVVGVQVALGSCNGVDYAGVVVGYWLSTTFWLGGGRHPWEISSVPTSPQDPVSGGTEMAP